VVSGTFTQLRFGFLPAFAVREAKTTQQAARELNPTASDLESEPSPARATYQ